MTVKDLNTNDFTDVLNNNNGIIILDFWAKWCGPCRSFATTYSELASKMHDVGFYKVNVEEEPELASKFGIRSIPHLIIFNKQEQVFSEPGTKSLSELENLLKKSLTDI